MRRPFVALPLEKHKVLRILDGKRSEYDGIDEAEDGGVSADAESEGEYSDGSEAGGFAHHAEGIVDVLKNASEQVAATLSQRYGLAIQIILDCYDAAREQVLSFPFVV